MLYFITYFINSPLDASHFAHHSTTQAMNLSYWEIKS
ncbi:MAG: hypothetical protein ACI9K1_002720, partial [Arcticibacterium sp.]